LGDRMGYELHESELLQWLKNHEGEQFSAILCDPPYHLTSITERFGKAGSAPAKGGVYNRSAKGFMSQTWDGGDISFQPSTWAAIKKVLYPGAFGMAFAGSRGWHRMACAIEDAGMILHPTIFCWNYSTGFPKATRIDLSINKKERGCPQGTLDPESPNTGKYKGGCSPDNEDGRGFGAGPAQFMVETGQRVEQPMSEEAQAWAGHRYGLQAMKPAAEPIIVFQAPYIGRPLDCITATGAGALNIDGGRIGTAAYDSPHTAPGFTADKGWNDNNMKALGNEKRVGRWPANFCLCHTPECKRVGTKQIDSTPAHPLNGTTESPSGYGTITQRSGEVAQYADENGKETVDDWSCPPECPVRKLNEQSGILKSGKLSPDHDGGGLPRLPGGFRQGTTAVEKDYGGDEGGASRFFFNADWNYEVSERLFDTDPFRYCPKASRSEREAGLEQFPANSVAQEYGLERSIDNREGRAQEERTSSPVANHHPTVKPISLNRWLATILLPPTKYSPRRILVPFAGVGSEMIGAVLAGWDEVVGVEMMPEYAAIARARIAHWSKGGTAKATPRKVAPRPPATPPKRINTLDDYQDEGDA